MYQDHRDDNPKYIRKRECVRETRDKGIGEEAVQGNARHRKETINEDKIGSKVGPAGGKGGRGGGKPVLTQCAVQQC